MPTALILAALLSTPPTTARVEVTIFDCQLGAKHATVTVEGDRFTYRYGGPDKSELTISGYGGRNVHAYWGRYVSPLYQLRFTQGEYSYILYSMAANEQLDSSAVAGLTVMRGGKVLSDRSCKPWAKFTGGSDAMDALPQDDEKWSAMAL